VTSFFIAGTDLVWQPSISLAIIVLAIAQMGIDLVFFLHITTGADNANNVLMLAFGLLIVFLVIGGRSGLCVSIRSLPRRVHSRGLWRRGSRSGSPFID
jgi:heme/copper-type cytochrome/quinol oxidase subunit 4